MKYTVGIITIFLALSLSLSCASVDPLKDLPETEYEQAQKYRTRIEKLEFAQYAPDEFAAGEAAFQAGEEKYKKDNLASKASFDEANTQYRVVMRQGIVARMKMSEDEIAPVKEKAVTIRADVAAKDEYQDAVATHDRAVTLANDENWEEAEPVFSEAKQKYEASYEAARNKKDKADDQIEETNQVMDRLRALVGSTDGPAKDEEMAPEDEYVVPEGDYIPEEEYVPEDDYDDGDEMLFDGDDGSEDDLPPEDDGV